MLQVGEEEEEEEEDTRKSVLLNVGHRILNGVLRGLLSLFTVGI
jgi:hypothetical protein